MRICFLKLWSLRLLWPSHPERGLQSTASVIMCYCQVVDRQQNLSDKWGSQGPANRGLWGAPRALSSVDDGTVSGCPPRWLKGPYWSPQTW